MHLSQFLATVMLLYGTFGVSASSTDEPLGSTTLARSRGDAVAIWDSSPVLKNLIQSGASRPAVMHELEANALAVLTAELPLVKRTARTLTVRVVYFRTGDISPTYKDATFTGVETVETLTVPTSIVPAASWGTQARRGIVPRSVTIHIVGALPPEIR